MVREKLLSLETEKKRKLDKMKSEEEDSVQLNRKTEHFEQEYTRDLNVGEETGPDTYSKNVRKNEEKVFQHLRCAANDTFLIIIDLSP